MKNNNQNSLPEKIVLFKSTTHVIITIIIIYFILFYFPKSIYSNCFQLQTGKIFFKLHDIFKNNKNIKNKNNVIGNGNHDLHFQSIYQQSVGP